jgi:hypothetical protein
MLILSRFTNFRKKIARKRSNKAFQMSFWTQKKSLDLDLAISLNDRVLELKRGKLQ